MEGSILVYKNKMYSRYWGILDGQQFSYYQKLDKKSQEPIHIQGVIFIQNADIQKVIHQGRSHCISIKCEHKKYFEYIDCESMQNLSDWYKTLIKASTWHIEERKRIEAPMLNRSILGISSEIKLSQQVITKAYRKLCLKAHPDKGGDVNRFSEIHQAYTNLMAVQVDLDEKAVSEEVEYEAVIEKAGGGIGLGIVVLEDPITHRITVQTVQQNICLRGLSEEANDEILRGDFLVAIEHDDCRMWPLSRIRARLNNFRVPVGSSVRMTLCRRVRSHTSDPTDRCDQQGDNIYAGVTSEALSPPQRLSSQRLSMMSSNSEGSAPEAGMTPKATPRSRKAVTPSPVESPPSTAGRQNEFEQEVSEMETDPLPESMPTTGVASPLLTHPPLNRSRTHSEVDDAVGAGAAGREGRSDSWDSTVFSFEGIDSILQAMDIPDENGHGCGASPVGLPEAYCELRDGQRMRTELRDASEKAKSTLRRCEILENAVAEKDAELTSIRNEKNDLLVRTEEMSEAIIELRDKNTALSDGCVQVSLLDSNEKDDDVGTARTLYDIEGALSLKRNSLLTSNRLATLKFILRARGHSSTSEMTANADSDMPSSEVPQYVSRPQAIVNKTEAIMEQIESHLSDMLSQ